MNLMRLTYGNGTQIVRIEGETAKRFTIRRYMSGEWFAKTATISKTDDRIHAGFGQEELAYDLQARMRTRRDRLVVLRDAYTANNSLEWLAKAEDWLEQNTKDMAELSDHIATLKKA